MIRLLIISHALIEESSQERWRQLAKSEDVSIRILIPERWEATWFGTRQHFNITSRREESFEVCPCPTTNHTKWSTYLIKNLGHHIRGFRPNVILCIHEEGIWQLHKTILWRRLFLPRAKLIYFSMNQFPRVPSISSPSPRNVLKWLYRWALWQNVRFGTDGAIGHYPAIRERVRADGYSKPFLTQTQIGVDPDLFHPSQEARKEVRDQLGLHGFVIGTCGRITKAKGIHDLLHAVQRLQADWQLLFVGDGDSRRDVEAWASAHNLKKQVHISGLVPRERVARLMQGMDCFFLGSRTTETWIDTFPLAVAQAMATGLPVIGSSSGAIPYQLGGEGLVFPEGDVERLRDHLQVLADNRRKRKDIGERLLVRANENFCLTALNRQFVDFVLSEIICAN